VGNALCFRAKFSIVTTNEPLDRVEGILRVEDDWRRAICPTTLFFAEANYGGVVRIPSALAITTVATLHDDY